MHTNTETLTVLYLNEEEVNEFIKQLEELRPERNLSDERDILEKIYDQLA